MNSILKQQLKTLVQSINYMAHEVNLYMSKVILESGEPENRYATRYEVNQNMEVKFYIYNTETETTVCKTYTYEEFACICTDKIIMMTKFQILAEQLVEKSKTRSKDIINIIF